MMRKRLRGVAAALVLLPCVAAAQQSGAPEALAATSPNRFAIVIGNDDYANVSDLKNAGNDGRLMADFLADQGYVVFRHDDLSKKGFEQLLRSVLLNVGKDSEVVFYYAGHGLQIAGGNYLVPVDSVLDDAYDVPFETVSLSSIVKIISARARTQLIILDSCRVNPFGNTLLVTDLDGGLSEMRDGFNSLTAPINSLLSFSTSPGTVAYDGLGSNSPFTSAVVEAANAAPDMPLGQLFEEVRRMVYQETGGKQVPWESSTLVERVSFSGPVSASARDSGLAEPAGRNPAAIARSADQADAGISLVASLEPDVAIGAALRSRFDLTPSASLEIVSPPERGRLTISDAGGRSVAVTAASVSGPALDTLIYISEMLPQPALSAPVPAVADQFTVAVAGEQHQVRIMLDADPCDAQAGDHLDPEGVGLTRYPNEIEPAAALAACVEAVGRSPETARFHYQLGRAHLALRETDAARASFERARDIGHTRAWVALGNLVASEAAITGGKADVAAPEAAMDLYRNGVDLGDPYAYHALGKQLLRFGETEAERKRGFELLSRALELGHTFSMNELGSYFVDPASADGDPARGLRYLRESAGRGDIYGYNNLGVVYRDGLAGVQADPEMAFDWFRKAADGGHPHAPGNLGRLWNSGALGQAGQFAETLKWYDLGLERGDGWGGANGAWIIWNRDVAGFGPRDAALRAAKAAALGNREAAEAARQLMEELPGNAVDGASQVLMNDLGASLEIDGSIGPATLDAMADVSGLDVAALSAASPVERAVLLAGAYWKASKFRVDLN